MKPDKPNKLQKLVTGFEIIKASTTHEEMTEYAKKGALTGKYLGFPNMHKNYTMSLPGVTDWTGFPRSGKTQVLMEFLMTTSIFYGWRHLLYFPDVGDHKEILADLIHKKTGFTFDKKMHNHITSKQISSVLDWILHHFIILTKKDLRAKITPYQFWDLAVEIKEKEGLHTASIDAWKDMLHETHKFGRDDKYLEDVLSYRNAIAERHGLHLHQIVHPIKTDKNAKGVRVAPSPYDMKGGTEWYNNGKSMVTVHRLYTLDNAVEINWNKIKPRSIGEEGQTIMYFDTSSLRYYWKDGSEKHFATKEYFEPLLDRIKDINDDDNEPLDKQEEIPF